MTTDSCYTSEGSSLIGRDSLISIEPPDQRVPPFRHCSYAHTRYPEMVTSFCLLPPVGGSFWCAEHAIAPEAGV